jgi:hypothetical protein
MGETTPLPSSRETRPRGWLPKTTLAPQRAALPLRVSVAGRSPINHPAIMQRLNYELRITNYELARHGMLID